MLSGSTDGADVERSSVASTRSAYGSFHPLFTQSERKRVPRYVWQHLHAPRCAARPDGDSQRIHNRGQRLPDEVAPDAVQIPLDEIPDDALICLLGSRYCDTEKLSEH